MLLLPFSVKMGLACKKAMTRVSFSKGHTTCFHVKNSVTCLANCQNFSKLMCPLGSLEQK